MKRQLSISLRLSLWFSMAFMVGFAMFGTAMYLELSYSLAAGRDKTLLHRANRAVALLTSCHTLDATCVRRFDDLFAATPEGNLIHVFDERGKLLLPANRTSSEAFPWPQQPPLTERTFSKVRYQGGVFRMLVEPTTVDSRRYLVVIGGQLADNRSLVAQFRNGLLCAVPLFLLLSAAFGYLLSSRALRPVGKLITSFRTISIGNLSRRLPLLSSGDELEALTNTCNDMLARLEVAVGQVTRFTADASHELRSPLSYIYTQSEYALENLSLEEDTAECFREILHECEEATSLLNDMLTLARCDSGHTGMVFAHLDLNNVLQQVYSKALPLAHRKQHGLTFQAGCTGPVWIMGDEAGLRRLFWSLVENAIKYTPAGGAIAMRLQVAGEQAIVEIEDNGIGIPGESLPHIFDRFYRGDRARTEGTGLGLSIAKWISDLHRGGLSVRSRPEIGSTFHLCFGLVGAS